MARAENGECWSDIPLYDHVDYSGEFGERLFHARRVRLDPNVGAGRQIQGLAVVYYFNPEESGVEYDWLTFDIIVKEGL